MDTGINNFLPEYVIIQVPKGRISIGKKNLIGYN